MTPNVIILCNNLNFLIMEIYLIGKLLYEQIKEMNIEISSNLLMFSNASKNKYYTMFKSEINLLMYYRSLYLESLIK